MIRRLAVLVDRVLAGIESLLAILSLALLVVLSSYQMIARNLEQPSPGWIDPFLHQMVLWAGFLGAALAVRAGSHIRLDLLSHRLSATWGGRVQIMVAILSAMVCLLLARACWSFVLSEQEMASSEIAGVPGWIFPAIMPAAFLLMAIHFVLGPWLPAPPQGSSDPGGSP